MTTWSYPATNRLLFQAGVSLRQDRQFNGVPEETGDAIPVLDLTSSVAYGSRFVSTTVVGDTEYGDMGNQYAYQTRARCSYVTGSHAFKVGMQTMTGRSRSATSRRSTISSTSSGRDTPVQLKQGAYPHSQQGRLELMLGLYAQDQWTLGSLTLNLGVRYDGLNAYNPAQTRPGGRFLGADQLRGRLQRAELEGHQPPARRRVGPVRQRQDSAQGVVRPLRELRDDRAHQADQPGQRARRAYHAQLDRRRRRLRSRLRSDQPGRNGECGPYLNRNFGTAVITTRYATRRHRRLAGSAVQQADLGGGPARAACRDSASRSATTAPGTATRPSRTISLVTGADFTAFCVTAPADTRLPDGGGYPVCGNYDINPTASGKFDNLVIRAPTGNQTEVFNGIDVGMNGASAVGGRSNGGVSFGNTDYNNCGVPDVAGAVLRLLACRGRVRPRSSSRAPIRCRYDFDVRRHVPRGPWSSAGGDALVLERSRFEPSLGCPLTNATATDHPHSRAQHAVRGSLQPVRPSIQPPHQFRHPADEAEVRHLQPHQLGRGHRLHRLDMARPGFARPRF